MNDREPGGRLRVFVSSTMDDLVNERVAVCRKLGELNFEPVNAENWSPGGQNSWDRICQKIGSSDLVVLLLGDRYGWIPEEGPKGGLGKSVTHLEFEEARQRQLPILPFAKELKYKNSSKPRTGDEQKRDDFRDEVFGWASYFRGQQFRDCYQLADLIGAAIVELISEHFQRARIEARAATREPEVDSIAPPPRAGPVDLPPDLVEAVRTGRIVMLAGAGISLAAGLPSASAFAIRLVQAAAAAGTTLPTSVVGAAFTNIATDIELLHGRAFLVDAIRPLLRPPQGIVPTRAHRGALRLFRTIVTTNYDDLFERAAESAEDGRPIVENELVEPRLPEPVLVKFHGSFSRPETLVLSEREVLGLDRGRKNLWESLVALLRERPLVVIGSSLHDASLVRLCLEVGDSLRGWFAAPGLSATAARRLAAWNLKTIDASADTFLGALTIEVVPGSV